MKSKLFKKGTSLFLLVLLSLSLLSPLFPNKANAADEYGYVEIHFVDMNMNEIKDIQQWPIALTNGTGSYSYSATPIANYKVTGYTINGSFFTGEKATVYVNSSNTPDNPVRLNFIYQPVSVNKTVTLYVCLNDASDNFTNKVVSFTNLSSTSQEETFSVSDLVAPDPTQWVFDHSESPVSSNGGSMVTLPMSINSPDNQDIRFIFKPKSGGVTGPVGYTATNNELNDDGTSVVTQSNGLDNFGRQESSAYYDNGGGVNITVQPPAQSPDRSADLEFAFAIVEKQSGSPISALTNYSYKTTDNPLTFKFTADAAHWYVHFYYKKKNTDYPPGSINIVAENDELGLDGTSVLSVFGQTSNTYNDTTGGGLTLATTPPPQSPPRSDLTFVYAVVSKSADPQTAITNNVQRSSTADISYKYSSATPTWYVHFYYSPQGQVTPPEGGNIVFTPQNTPQWTNQGKTGNGTGSYPVVVQYVGSNPAVGQGTVTYHHDQPQPPIVSGNPPVSVPQPDIEYDSTHEFPVKYPLKTITVTGAASAVLTGTEGVVNITHEGKNLALAGKGAWGNSDISELPPAGQYETETGINIPPAPEAPACSGGPYNIDWTNPLSSFSLTPGIVSRSTATLKASQKGSYDSYYGTLYAADALSGLAEVDYGWSIGSSEAGCSFQTISLAGSAGYTQEIEKPVGDNLYFHIRTRDMAGNTNDQTYGPYEDAIWLGSMRITDIEDPSYEGVFLDKNLNHTGKYIAVNQMPVDNQNLFNVYPKKGYAFFFDFQTEYLYRSSDYITVTPKFYYYDGTNRGQEVDIYYNLNNNPFIKIGSGDDTVRLHMRSATDPKDIVGTLDIGSMSMLKLTDPERIVQGAPYSSWKGQLQYSNGKIQYWYGKYLIPATSIIVPKGMSPRPENVLKDGYILINFQVTAYKNGVESGGTNQIFNYVPAQWMAEGGPKSSKFQPGDVIIFNNQKSALDDFGTVITY